MFVRRFMESHVSLRACIATMNLLFRGPRLCRRPAAASLQPTVHGKPQHSRNAHWNHEPDPTNERFASPSPQGRGKGTFAYPPFTKQPATSANPRFMERGTHPIGLLLRQSNWKNQGIKVCQTNTPPTNAQDIVSIYPGRGENLTR